MNNLKILSWNANGIKMKINELQALSNHLKIDIILLSETRISPSTKLKMPNYHTYRNDIPPKKGSPPHGGTAVLVHRRIVHEPVYLNTSLQSTSIKIKLPLAEILISSIYKPPKTLLTTADLDTLTKSAGWFIAAGDYNSKHPLWYSRIANPAGTILNNHISTNDYQIIAPDSPTFFPSSSLFKPDVLDIALARTPYQINITNLSELSSDHNPILLEVSNSPVTSSPPVRGKNINWIKYSNILDKSILDINPITSNKNDIDKSLQDFTTTIQKAIIASTYPSNQRRNRNTLPAEIIREIKTKNRLRRAWQTNRDPVLKKRLNAQTLFVKNILSTHKQDEWDKFLDTLDLNDGSIFKLNKNLLKKRPATHPLSSNNGLVFAAKDKAELHAESLADQFSPNPGQPLTEVSDKFQELKANIITQSNLFTTPGTIKNIIKKLPKKKAPGYDNITNTALKLLPPSKILTLTKIINGCLKICYFPTAWKKAIIITIPKPGKDTKFPSNFRPIALLSSISKIYERIILTNLLSQCSSKIRDEQYAFREGHSSTQQLVNLVDQISVGLNNNKHTATVFLDVEKAFDRVWHEGLLYKLIQMNISTPTIKIIESFLSDRSFCVRIEDKLSLPRGIKAGVPQGSCLSPTLYSIFTNDLPTIPKAKVALFADDTMFFTQDQNKNRAKIQLQHQLDLASAWFTKWRLKINCDKTVAVLFSRTRSKIPKRLKINNQVIDWSSNVKYLGVSLNRTLNFNPHVLNIVKKATRTRGILYPILNRKSPVPLQTKINLIKMYICPILTHAGTAWAPFISGQAWKRLEAVQNISLRSASGSPQFVRNKTLLDSAQIKSIKLNIHDQSSAMFIKNSFSKYKHIRELGHYPLNTLSNKIPRPLSWAKQQIN